MCCHSSDNYLIFFACFFLVCFPPDQPKTCPYYSLHSVHASHRKRTFQDAHENDAPSVQLARASGRTDHAQEGALEEANRHAAQDVPSQSARPRGCRRPARRPLGVRRKRQAVDPERLCDKWKTQVAEASKVKEGNKKISGKPRILGFIMFHRHGTVCST